MGTLETCRHNLLGQTLSNLMVTERASSSSIPALTSPSPGAIGRFGVLGVGFLEAIKWRLTCFCGRWRTAGLPS